MFSIRVGLTSFAPLCIFCLAGCSGAPFTNSAKTGPVPGVAIQGKVHGGQTVITGANIYLYAANNTGYGNASISLLNSSGSNTQKDSNGNYYVTTGSDGSFGITGDYTCPSAASQLYLYAVGGNPGAGVNPVIGLLAALGPCPANGTLSPTLYIVINEVTTIAAAYALSGFATDATHVSSSGTPLALTGIANAFANAGNLANINTGNALTTTPAGNGTAPQVIVNTLADLLAACVNTTGVISGPTNPTDCYTLFNDTMSGGATGTVPTNTANAAIYLAHNPGANLDALASLYETLTADLPFQPAVVVGGDSNVNDLTVSIVYTAGGLDRPVGIAVDAAGNVWLANEEGTSVTELSSLGVALSGANGFSGGGISGPWGVAIDGQGHVWVANLLASTMTELSNTGAVLSPGDGYPNAYFSLGGVGVIMAIDGAGNVWIAGGNGGGVTKFSSAGAVLGNFTGSGLGQAGGVAVDGSGNAWFSNVSDDVSEFSSSGSALAGMNGYAVSTQPYGIAIDGSGNAWVGTVHGGITELSNSGNVLYTQSASANAQVFGIDGAGSAWTLGDGTEITGISSSGSILSGPYGYEPPSLYGAQAAAIDGSGDIWVANGGNNTVTQIIGAAVPVITPIAAGLPGTPTTNGTSNLGTRP